ncbi:hypothetical protein RRF57_003307 [Xylaria bambusicola]|uniref:Uncharacterized protein n=1 Tax=Xylaria bambusicola TaxID=326684 RepID=A0AAN7Z3A2_9PEZI
MIWMVRRRRNIGDGEFCMVERWNRGTAVAAVPRAGSRARGTEIARIDLPLLRPDRAGSGIRGSIWFVFFIFAAAHDVLRDLGDHS